MSVAIEDFNDLKARLFALEMEVEELKTSALTPSRVAPVPKLTPVKETPSPDEGGHIINSETSTPRSAAAKALWIDANPDVLPGDGEIFIQTCDEVECIAPDHREIMPKSKARTFNSQRVARLLEEVGNSLVYDWIMNNSTRISGRHVVVTTDSPEMFPLPGGRTISITKAQVFAHGEPVPSTVRRTCDYPGCISMKHLKVT